MADAAQKAPPDPVLVRAIEGLSLVAGVVAALLILASVAITCQMIFVRFVLNESTIWQTEAVVYMMIGATVIGLAYVQKLRGHVNVDLLPMILPQALRNALAVLVLVASLAIALLMLWYGFELFHIAWARGWNSDTVWGPPLWIPYAIVPIGFFLYTLQLAVDLWRVRRGETPFQHGDLEEDY